MTITVASNEVHLSCIAIRNINPPKNNYDL